MRDGGRGLHSAAHSVFMFYLPWGHRAVAMEAAVKPGTGSAKPFGAMVSPDGYREQVLWKNPKLRARLGQLVVE